MTPLTADRLPVALCAPIALGPEDFAVFDRLRAIATLFHAASGALPALAGIDLGLWIDRHRLVHPLVSATFESCLLIARTSGWRAMEKSAEAVVDKTLAQVAAAEFPHGFSPAILALLRQIRSYPPLVPVAALAFLARAGWRWSSDRILRPTLPHHPSAQEALDLLVAVEAAGGLGRGPLATLARQALATLGGGFS